MADERTSYLAGQTAQIVAAAIDRDHDTVARTLEAIGTKCGHDGVFQLCYALSGAVHQLVFPQVARGDGTLTGDMIAAVQMSREPASRPAAAMLWAARFVAAFINGDAGTTSSLFYGGLDDRDQTMSNVAALVSLAGDVARQKEREHRDRVAGLTPGEGIAATTEMVHLVNPLGVRTLCCNQPVISLPSGERWTDRHDLANCAPNAEGGADHD